MLWPTPTPTPVGRQRHAMVYDTARGVSVLFGGIDVNSSSVSDTNATYGDTWEFDGLAWQQKFPAHSPSARYGHAMTYDSARGVTVLFGGRAQISGQTTCFNDVWEWNGSDWSLVATVGASPSPRAYHGMAYDSARRAHVMHGGLFVFLVEGDTWEYNGAARTWLLRSQDPAGNGPSSRFWFQMVFDAARDRTLLFGGTQNTVAQFGDTWVWDGHLGAWAQLNPSAHPSPRQLYTLAYDSIRKVVLLQCGQHPSDNYPLVNDRESWEWDGANWQDMTMSYLFCCPREGGAMVYDTRLRQMVQFGGFGSNHEDIWMLKEEWQGPSVFVDWRNSGARDGSASHPFQTVRQASTNAADCTLLNIHAGDYHESQLLLNKPMIMEATNGDVFLR